jgi:restriction system protein
MIPKFNNLFYPILSLLAKKNHKRITAKEELEAALGLNEEDKNQKLKSGDSVFGNRVGWAFTFLTKAEFIEITEERATYKISDLGKKALEEATKNKQEIDENFLKKYSPNYEKNWQVIKTKDSSEDKKSIKTVMSIQQEEGENAGFDLEEELQRTAEEFDIELIQKIREMSWQNFEDFCARLLEKMGYGVAAKRDIRQRDGGIDGEILEDELGLKGRIYLQAKKYQSGSKVGVKDIKEFLYNIKNEKGVFITTSDFSEDAKNEVLAFKDAPIALINYKELIRLCKKYEHACRKKTIEIFKLD